MQMYPKYDKKAWTTVFKKATYTLKRSVFELEIGKIIDAMSQACQFIINSEQQCWTNSLFPGVRWDIVNNNLAETWNAWIKEVRSLSMMV